MSKSQSLTRREALFAATSMAGAFAISGFADGVESESTRTIPPVPGSLAIDWRRREKEGDDFRVIEETVQWNASETAIIICDMWADHPCKLAAMRVARMAPRMNEVISLARDQGVAIIHAPSSTMASASRPEPSKFLRAYWARATAASTT